MKLWTAFMLPMFCRFPSLNLPRDAMNWTSACTDSPELAFKTFLQFWVLSHLSHLSSCISELAAKVCQVG